MNNNVSKVMRAGRHWRAILEVTATVLAMALCVDMMWTIRATSAAGTSVRPTRPRPEPPKLPTAPISIEGAATAGSKTAPLAMIEYSDYQCPYCGTFARDVEPILKKDYVEPGKLLLVFKNLPLETIHPFAFKAAESAECAARQGKFWEMHDILFKNQKLLDLPNLKQHAAAAGLDIPKFDACIDDQTKGHIKDDIASGKQLQIAGTPSFFVGLVQPNGLVKVTFRFSGVVQPQQLKGVLDNLLATSLKPQ